MFDPSIGTGSRIAGVGSDGILLASREPKRFAEFNDRMLSYREMRIRYGKEGTVFVEKTLS